MKVLAALTILIITPAAFATSMAKLVCINGLEMGEAEFDSTRAVIQRAKTEIASLLLERSKLTSAQDQPVRLIIERNITKKLAEFKTTFGFDLERAEVRSLIEQLEGNNQAHEKIATEIENGVRTGEKNSRLQWSFAPAVTKANFLPHDLTLDPRDFEMITDAEGHASRVIYRIQEAADPQRGHHILDVTTGADIYVGDHLGSLDFFKGQKQEWLVTAPSKTNPAEMVIELRDSRTGLVTKTYTLADKVPNFSSRRFLNNARPLIFEKADGQLGIFFTWVTAINKPEPLFELDLATGNVEERGTLDYDSAIFTSPDHRRIYSYGFSPLNLVSETDARKTLTVTDVVKNTQIFQQEFRMNEKVDAQMLGSRDLAMTEDEHGQPLLAVNFYRTDKTVIHHIFENKTDLFDRLKDANSGGIFVAGNGVTYFLPTPSQKSPQAVINLSTKSVYERNRGQYLNNRLVAAVNLPKIGPVLFYNVTNGLASPHFINIVVIDDQQVGNMAYDVSGLGAVELMTAYATADGRINGVVLNNIGLKHNLDYNLHLVQLYGPPMGAP